MLLAQFVVHFPLILPLCVGIYLPGLLSIVVVIQAQMLLLEIVWAAPLLSTDASRGNNNIQLADVRHPNYCSSGGQCVNVSFVVHLSDVSSSYSYLVDVHNE